AKTLMNRPSEGGPKEVELALLTASGAVRRPSRAGVPPGRGFPPGWVGRPEPPQFPHAGPHAVTPCACLDAKGDAARCPRGWRCDQPARLRGGPRPTPLPGCTATG